LYYIVPNDIYFDTVFWNICPGFEFAPSSSHWKFMKIFLFKAMNGFLLNRIVISKLYE